MRERVEACHEGYLRYGVLTGLDQFRSFIELIGFEECAGTLTCESFYLIVEFGARDMHHFCSLVHVELCIGHFLFHHLIKFVHEVLVLCREHILHVFVSFRRGGENRAYPFAIGEQRLDHCHQHFGRKGLGDVGVSTTVEAFHFVFVRYLCCNQYHRDVAGL